MCPFIRFKSFSQFIVFAFALGCFAFSLTAQAVSPAPDGSYPGRNTAEGDSALFSLTTGLDNTAIGSGALFDNTEGDLNTATGASALAANTTGGNNTATGVQALFSNTTGGKNTATGVNALFSNTGDENTASGFQALYSNTYGGSNTATGTEALLSNTTGFFNTATGLRALPTNSAGSANTATGVDALLSNTTGNFNTATGFNVLTSNTTGSSNIALGTNAGSNLTAGDNNIDASQTNTFIAGIYGATIAKGINVVVDSTGHLGTKGSAERFKTAIKPMNNASEALLALNPVTFCYKKEIDPESTPQFGLVAEEVAKVDPDLVARDAAGKIYTVRYDEVNAMLLNEFLKEHRQVKEQAALIAQQQKNFEAQRAQIKALTAAVKEQESRIQKVSAQVELNEPAPQVAATNQ